MTAMTEAAKRMAGEKAAAYFGNGFHCAEAVVSAVLDAVGEDPLEATAHATAFGGGFGRSHQEACGALSGALVAIGHMHGRRRQGDEWELAAKLGAQIRQRFVDDFGTAHCGTLRARFGSERQMAECRKVTQKVTAALLSLLAAHQAQHKVLLGGCEDHPSGMGRQQADEPRNAAPTTSRG